MYDYKEAVKEDVKQFIYDNYTKNEIKEKIENRSEFEETLNHNWDLREEAFDEFWQDFGEMFRKGIGVCDVAIRCYLLPNAISGALDEIEYEIEYENK